MRVMSQKITSGECVLICGDGPEDNVWGVCLDLWWNAWRLGELLVTASMAALGQRTSSETPATVAVEVTNPGTADGEGVASSSSTLTEGV